MIIVLYLIDRMLLNHTKANELSAELHARWSVMTQEEKIKETKHTLEELKSCNENKQLAVQNTAISSFHDGCTNLDSIETEVRNHSYPVTVLSAEHLLQIKNLNACTGVKVILITVQDT